jgi:hypothetical protein
MFKLLKLTSDDIARLLPANTANPVQYIQSGGKVFERAYRIKEVGQCGIVDCLNNECPICRRSIVLWRKAVKERDHYACINCGPGRPVQAHHLLQRVNFPEKAFDVRNGVTLCDHCHHLAHASRRAD